MYTHVFMYVIRVPTCIDECSRNVDDCDTNAVCTNTPGSFTCACNAGYTGDGKLCTSKYMIHAYCNIYDHFLTLCHSHNGNIKTAY